MQRLVETEKLMSNYPKSIPTMVPRLASPNSICMERLELPTGGRRNGLKVGARPVPDGQGDKAGVIFNRMVRWCLDSAEYGADP